jgi:subtilisin family serine protease
MIVMREQANLDVLLPVVRKFAPAERRAFARAELKSRASVTQNRVRSYLATEEAAGRAANVRSLWIASGVVAEMTPAAIEGLLALSEIRTILWDPPIPDEEANDRGEMIRENRTGSLANPVPEIWQLESVNAPDVWALGYEGDGIVVAVEDNGVDRTHPDIATHMWNNEDEIPGNGTDDDSNGYVDDTWGWNFAENNNNPMPAGDDHGTKCAGIVAGDGTDGIRTGVAPKALIMACRVSSWGQNILGIQYAIDNGAHVITMSRSEKWRFTPKPDYDWWRSITDGELLTGIFHANSIGNEGDNQNTDPVPFNIAAPGCCPTPWRHPDQVQAGVSGITSGCGAIDSNDVIANYSSIGPFAWEDIQVHWPEYPHDMRPEYQDYPWWWGLPGLLKPDVVAPGPGTTSIAIGGGYGSFGGTSAATPHVAGGMALILSANPFLTPEEMAMVLQTTAVELGSAGKDTRYGAGKLDCLAAVQLALIMNNFGFVQGTVTDQENGNPIPDVDVQAMGDTWNTKTDTDGDYTLGLPEGDWTLQYTNFFYEDGSADVEITAQQTIVQDIALTRKATGTVMGRITDAESFDPIEGAEIELPNTPLPTEVSDARGRYSHTGVPVGSYTVVASKFGYEPGGESATVTSGGGVTQINFDLSPALLALDMETDPGWTAGIPGDNATTGVWVRVDPNGTGAQPEDDHTPDPGVLCWVTGQGTPGGALGENDVDNGKTTLLTGVIDLSSAPSPAISYWAWYSNDQGTYLDDEWVVEITNDGVEWTELLRMDVSTSGWEYFQHRVAEFVTPTANIQVRFVASDEGSGSIVEAAIDDFQVFTNVPATDVTPVPGRPGARLVLHPNAPNPFASSTSIRFMLPATATVDLRIFDVAGRLIRTLASGERREAGLQQIRWDGRDAGGSRVASGVYFYRVDALDQSVTERVVRVK